VSCHLIAIKRNPHQSNYGADFFPLTVPGCHASSGLLTLNVNALNVCHGIEDKAFRIQLEPLDFDGIPQFSHARGAFCTFKWATNSNGAS
jgi:hypothetical protein